MRAQRQLMLQLQMVTVAKVFKDMLGVPDAIAYLEKNGFSFASAEALLVGDGQAMPDSACGSRVGEAPDLEHDRA